MSEQTSFVFPAARASDPVTSHQAAATVAPKLGKIQREVLEAFRTRGAMTARKAERLCEFEQYGFSTVRKRISELARMGYLVEAGIDRSGRSPAIVYVDVVQRPKAQNVDEIRDPRLTS